MQGHPFKFENYLDKNFGSLKPISLLGRRGTNNLMYLGCNCGCGRYIETNTKALFRGKVNCGQCEDVVKPGGSFGKLLILKIYSSDNPHKICVCRCDCGILLETFATYIRTGKKIDCGCQLKDDLTEQEFGRWKVLSHAGKNKHGHQVWNCGCSCDLKTEKVVDGDSLRAGQSKSCGCLHSEITSEIRLNDLTGQIFSSLHVIRRDKNKGRRTLWLCECKCGNFVSVMADNLVSGNSTSCGDCYRHSQYYPFWEKKYQRYDPYNQLVKWRAAVLKKDGKACQICQSKHRLCAHHMDAWASFEKRRFDVSNGATLCHEHHKDFHSKYGSGRNTEGDYMEYKNEHKSILPV